MSWSLAQSIAAARMARAAGHGRRAHATVRPRSVLGLLHTRAPLALLLYAAAKDGLVVEAGGGFALLQRPFAEPRPTSGGFGLRLLRWLDRRWDGLLFAVPPAATMLAGLAAGLLGAPTAGVILVLVALAYVAVGMVATVVFQLGWIAGLGGQSRRRAAESLPAYHWHVPLLHQPNPDRMEELLAATMQRLTALIRQDLRDAAGGRARTDRTDITETLVVLSDGITTQAARTALAASVRRIHHDPEIGGVILLTSPGWQTAQPSRRLPAAGPFALLYGAGMAAVVAVCASFVADVESQACAAASCDGRPSTYASALRWLLYRLVFADPPHVSPATARVVLLGWLISVASAMGVVVVIVVVRQELRRSDEAKAAHASAIGNATTVTRTLILVTADVEREAVFASIRERIDVEPATDQTGSRTIYTLGPVGGTMVLLAQAPEQGTASAAGMLVTAQTVIAEQRPDFVILVGICYGLRPSEGQHIGDIVVARRVQNVDHRKVTERDGAPFTINRGVNVGTSPGLLDRLQAGQSTWDAGRARVHIGTVLTSNTLANSRAFVEQLRTEFPDAIAGEMEATAVHEAATLSNKPDWIMVKAISDWGYGKTDADQVVAARNAADYVTHVLAGGALAQRRPAADRNG